MPPKIRPVILCGGSGTRLWPVSRESFPKQFGQLTGDMSLFQQCARRLSGPDFGDPVVVTASAFRFVVLEQLAEAGVSQADVLIEPQPRDTAAAVLAAAIHIALTDPDAVLLVAPSDHLIPDVAAFTETVLSGLDAVGNGDIVTFGIRPDRPETGFGYVEIAPEHRAAVESGRIVRVRRFVEKPDPESARAMLDGGLHLWNGGLFLCHARDMIAAFELWAPDLVEPVRRAVEEAKDDLGFRRLDAEGWSAARSVSIDYAVMEHATNISVAPYRASWSDLGDWNAVWRESPKSEDGVACSEGARAIGCADSLLHTYGSGVELIGIGLEDMIVVAMPDAVLAAPRGRSQDVKRAVAELKARGTAQATEFPRDRRPWGWFESVTRGERHQVKRLVVRPGAALSLQSHVHRAEHWVVVSGTARVTIGDEARLVSENESVYIPLGAVHRLENPGKFDLHVIEVQTGSYLGEDDIVRYDDVYARSPSE